MKKILATALLSLVVGTSSFSMADSNTIGAASAKLDTSYTFEDMFAEIFEIGVEAEINNIAMYEEFLEEDLPDDIRDVFEKLMNASENHLKAFSRGVDSNNGNRVRGRRSNQN